MRSLPDIVNVWNSGGPFVGDNKPVTRVMVQDPWPDLAGTSKEKDFLRTTSTSGTGSSASRGVPMRWYQNQSNSQSMTELPNIKSVNIDRSIDQDAASINISLDNQWMYTNGNNTLNDTTAGQPGYFTPTRGDSIDSARWGHAQNEWNDVLVPNAVLRVYTGFGGDASDYPNVLDAVAAGKLALYGVFLVDEVSIATGGGLSIRGRDMAKLLIEQQLFPPLVPNDKYPLSYYRWKLDPVRVRTGAKTFPAAPTVTGVTAGDKNTTYRDSEVDRWYGANASLYGHRGAHACDGNPHSYYLGVGNSGPDKPFAVDWVEFNCGEVMNAVYMHPWAGNYTMYVSVYENGAWQGSETVPYDPSSLYQTQYPVVNTGANIPYVASFKVPWEKAQDYVLPRAYNASRVRLSFRNLADSGLGTWKFRAGVREARMKGVTTTAGNFSRTQTDPSGTVKQFPYIQAADSIRNPDKTYSTGYITASVFDQIDAFGDARRKTATTHTGEDLWPTAIRFTPDAGGYYTLSLHGKVRAHGDAVWYGDLQDDQGFVDGEPHPSAGYAWDMAVTHTGNGYWIISEEGYIYAYGDAPQYSNRVTYSWENDALISITAHPSAMGFWTLLATGRVHAFGAATTYGHWPTTLPPPNVDNIGMEQTACIRSTSTGNGYWILSNKGRVKAFGDAKNHGEPGRLVDFDTTGAGELAFLVAFSQAYWELLPAPDDKGYLLLNADGTIDPFGEVDYFGAPVPGTIAELRSDGNYLDYSDIAKDLARWSGFLFYDPSHPSSQPAPVYGAVESTGAWAKERLPDEIFDKKPVVDALTEIREVVGYICHVDAEGRFVWRSPNTWHVGNFDEDGFHVEELPEIDERIQLIDYSTGISDDPLRSSVIITSHDPYADLSGTITTNYTPPSATKLRGLVKPAMWINQVFTNEDEQQIMAELIGLQISFQERQGSVTCVASPHIEIDDQVRIYERQTDETNIHYVRGVSFNHDLDSGSYTMTLTTHWLASGESSGDVIGGTVAASAELQERILNQQFGKFYVDNGERLS